MKKLLEKHLDFQGIVHQLLPNAVSQAKKRNNTETTFDTTNKRIRTKCILMQNFNFLVVKSFSSKKLHELRNIIGVVNVFFRRQS